MSSRHQPERSRATLRVLSSRYAGVSLKDVTGRLAELVPPASQRCQRSPLVGASRVLAGAARGFLRPYRSAAVAVGGTEMIIDVDLRTPQGRRLFAYGFCEPAAAAMQGILKPGDAMIDGGANIGLYTLLAASCVGSLGRVVACEPAPATMALLRANIARNQLRCVSLRDVALAEEPGRMVMQVFEAGSGFSSFAPADAARATAVDVEATTLDQLASEIPQPVSLVKLDVEGAEHRALRGATRLLEDARPDFIVEFEPVHLERQGASATALKDLFDAADYVAYRIGTRLERMKESWVRAEGDPNILLRPRSRARD